MEAITNPWSPSSLQLRLSRRCSPPSRLPFKIRFRPLIRRVRLVSASGIGGNARSSPDSFSGGDPKKKKGGLGGMLGAGLAGVLFVAGVTYASLSLSSRTTSGAKQHLEPLTTKQELALSFDDEGEKVFEVGKESNVVVTGNGSKTIDHNSETGTALLATPGKVLVPAVIDQVQCQTLSALQVLKVIEADVRPGDLCTRREYARWLVTASCALSRSTISKIYPAMFIENVTELAFDDVTPEDPDFSFIQGLAEAGIISSKLSKSDLHGSSSEQHDSFLFSPESPVSRQDLVSWKMALATRQLPEVDRKYLYEHSGYLDIDKIDPNAWPALIADLSSGEQGITVLAFGYTRLFQPNKPVTKAQAAIALATGDAADVVVEELTRIEAESLAETVVNTHAALVAQVEKDLNASYEKELSLEREKINAVEKLAEEARLELDRLRAEREEENNALIRRRAAVESEMEILSKLRQEVEDQLQDLMGSKLQISFEKDTINKLRKEAESENQVIVQLQYELEVERKALSMARSWAEEEAKRAREQAKALEEARERWARHGIKVVVDSDLKDDASTGTTWFNAGNQPTPVAETINRANKLVEKLRAMAAEIKLRSSVAIETIIQKIVAVISSLKQRSSEASKLAKEYHSSVVSSASRSIEEVKENAYGFGSSIGDRAKRAVEDCKGSVDRLSQKFKA